MSISRQVQFSSIFARLQYMILMVLFRMAVTRGLYGTFARGLAHVFNPQNIAFLSIEGAPPFRIHLNDAYWTRFALYHQEYEPEIEGILKATSGHSLLFCDLGANKGYWTTRAAALFPRVIAVEASQKTYDALTANAGSLSNVTLKRAAIHSETGHEMTFANTYQSHASARLLDGDLPGSGDVTETVQTLKVDDLIPDGIAAVIKMDVEGAEVAAIMGAKRALQNGSLVLFEDHGSDTTCAPSAYLLSQTNIRVYSIEKHMKQVISVSEVQALKTDPFKGYNFLAVHDDSALLSALAQHFANHR